MVIKRVLNSKSNYESLISRINDLQHRIAQLSAELPEKSENVLGRIERNYAVMV
jgi:hypothetical protein